MSKIQIKPSCILNVPLKMYSDDFSFIVNGKEFKTSRIISDLLSPRICQIHTNDPTVDRYEINTQHSGDFSHILDLFNFKQNNLPESELPFILEVIENLDNEFIEYDEVKQEDLSIDNVLERLKKHEKYKKIYSNVFSSEIEFIASHFSEICTGHEEELLKLSIESVEEIVKSKNLQIETEDELVRFLNVLYNKDHGCAPLYGSVLFENVSSEMMKEFISIYDASDMTCETWKSLSKRLELQTQKNEKLVNKNRYKKVTPRGIEFVSTNENEFKGIINHLRSQSNNKIENEVIVTASSVLHNVVKYHPQNVVLFVDQSKWFGTNNEPNCWLKLDFKDRRVIPTDYIVKSFPAGVNSYHPKSWLIEGSNDDQNWDSLDKQDNCSYLNGYNCVHTFKMSHQSTKEYRYIRMKLTGPNWHGNNYFAIDSIDIYGKLI